MLQIDRRELVEHGCRIAGEARATGETFDNAGPALLERGQHVVSQKVTVETQIVIGRIVQPSQTLCRRVRFQRSARDVDERPCQPATREGRQQSDSGQAGGAAAPHEVQQQRLGLVVAMMRTQ